MISGPIIFTYAVFPIEGSRQNNSSLDRLELPQRAEAIVNDCISAYKPLKSITFNKNNKAMEGHTKDQ